MARFVPDIQTHRWVIISPQRMSRPSDASKHAKRSCPFCEGNEFMTPPEVLRKGSGEKDAPGWNIRVIPNKYPVTDIHEVIVHSPDGERDLHELTQDHVQMLLAAYRDRFNFYKKQGQVLLFSNHSLEAGASLDHPHSQLVVLPNQINMDALTRQPINNVVEDKEHFSLYCPDFSQWPYELWIIPKRQGILFGDLNDNEINELSEAMRWSIRKLYHIYRKNLGESGNVGYNFYIYPKENWYMRIIPRFVQRAGFELGTGLSVNIIDPADAAETYKKI